MFALAAVSSFAQNSPLVGTVIDVDEGRNRLQIEADSQAGSRITIETDAISTVYQGFGTVIAGKPEIFTGSTGLSNVRLGDRVEIRGVVKSQNVYRADQINLLGRQVAASSVGVGQTRTPTSVATQTDDRVTGSTDVPRSVEGTIRTINLNENRIVIQTTDRTMLTVRATRNTPVYYRNERYTINNLELGDRIRVEPDTRTANTDELTARSIEVTASVQDTGTAPGNGAVVTIISGRVTRVEPGLDYVYVDDGRNGEIRVDMRQASDAAREPMRARDMKIGDQVEISGSYNRTGDMFLASTVRFGAGTPTRASDIGYQMDDERLSVVSITGTITETLEDASTL
ncbi:MAG TPA: DUF5666 domain-containing protein, partial [Thermoanaerobaculia bacterium]|nr:DUF5666 domain-containing protein [Thermoanaerobaculia bacterium]